MAGYSSDPRYLHGTYPNSAGQYFHRLSEHCVDFRGHRDIIIHHHPTMLVWLLFNLHWSWILGIVTAITFDRTQSLSYGQLLSLAAPIPGLIAFTNIFRKNWRNVKSFIFKIPSLLSEGLCFIATGKEKWTEQRELNPDYFDWSGRRWAIGKYLERRAMWYHCILF
jgi:hypothetical protein